MQLGQNCIQGGGECLDTGYLGWSPMARPLPPSMKECQTMETSSWDDLLQTGTAKAWCWLLVCSEGSAIQLHTIYI